MKGHFENDWHETRANLVAIGAKLKLKYAQIFEPFDITHQQFNALRILRGRKKQKLSESFSTQDLRAALVDKSADSSRLVDRLISKGWVLKEPCGIDTRRVNIMITDDGLKLLDILDKKTKFLNDLMMVIPETKIKQLNKMLHEIDDALS
jgi:DNA-binding MarR family transcriptional regulator